MYCCEFVVWMSVFQCLLPTCLCRKNVLFLVSDDMRPQLGAFTGPDFPSPVHPKMVTPYLDKLASKSLLMKRAYIQEATCSPSRTSFLTGRRPDTTHVYDLVSYFRKVGGNFTTLPQYFKQNGYLSVGMGKVFHPGAAASGHDDPISWSVPYYQAPNKPYWTNKNRSWYAVPPEERKNKPLPDEQLAARAKHVLRTLAPKVKRGQENFFLAVGFYKPHLPFVFPEEFLDFYHPHDIRLPPNPYAPNHMPNVSWCTYKELRNYRDIARTRATGDINTTLPVDTILDLRRAYYSAVSYVDALVGTILHELESLGLDKSTIVSFVGDHGWHLGENGEWTKHTNFEQSTHAPMIIHIPGVTDNGIVSRDPVEMVDLFPTLAEAASLPPLPVCPPNSTLVKLCREGTSLFPLAVNKSLPWKHAAFSQYPRSHGVMGYTMRTDRYRYTEWPLFQKAPIYKPVWGSLEGVELYDHNIDPEENNNVADKASYASVRSELSRRLRAGWRGVHI